MILNICIFRSIFGMLLNFNYLAYPFHNKYNKSKHFLQIHFFITFQLLLSAFISININNFSLTLLS